MPRACTIASVPWHLRAATRASRLALWQTNFVAARLRDAWPGLTVELVPIETRGDRVLDVPLSRIGDKGLFTRELEDALRAGDVHFAVHSLKDLPTSLAEGMTVSATIERVDPRDALVAREPATIETLPAGARVGTSSLRRRAQLLALRPDLDVRDLRGNVPTRVTKVVDGELDAAVLALAGLQRLDLEAHVAKVLEPEVMLPAPGQGALAVEVAEGRTDLARLFVPLDDQRTRLAVVAERAVLAELEGGCQVPIGALARFGSGDTLTLDAGVFDLDGASAARVVLSAPVADEAAAESLGREAAAALRARGGAAILARVRFLPRGGER